MNSIRRFFPRQYLLPIALLVVTSFTALFTLLYYLTAIQDRMDTERDRLSIDSALESLVEFAVHDLQDYSIWDDAARELLMDFDPGWADANISVYLGSRQGYSHVFIVQNDDTPLYSYDFGMVAPVPSDPFLTIGQGLRRGIEDAGLPQSHGLTAEGGFSRAGGRVFLYAVSDITPLSEGIAVPDGLRRTLVIASELDVEALRRLSERYGTARLRISLDGTLFEGEEAVTLAARDGSTLGQIAWAPDRPGTALMHEILPGFLMIAMVSFFAAGLILNRARLSNEALVSSRVNIRYLAYHDALTALPNRRRLLDSLRTAPLAQMQLLYMDLDGFKEANDVYGHAIGDDLLIEAARRIRGACDAEVLVARTGGDEFAVLLPGGHAGEPARTAESILLAFEPPFHVSGYSVNIGVSIGAAKADAGIEGEELMRRADVAMYGAKSRGRRGWLAYEPHLDDANQIRHAMEGALRMAVDRGEIDVAFQPIVDAVTGQIVNVEALARWEHATLGNVSPEQFIRVAEQSGLINELGRRVLIKACKAALHWNVRLSVNLSPVQFWDRNLVSSITGALAEIGFPPERLDLEITERYLLRRPEEAERILRSFRQLGIRISLDDFGTGYASLGYLQRLSLDRIKMDRSFVVAVEGSDRATRLAAAIVDLGAALNLPVTAEGVETEAQAIVMRRIGCSHLQGWLYGHALTAEEVEQRLRQAAEIT